MTEVKTADDVLTPREVQVLKLILEGKSSREVADALFVSKRTVDFHLANIFEKLNVNSRVQAFRRAAELGIIPDLRAGRGLATQPA